MEYKIAFKNESEITEVYHVGFVYSLEGPDHLQAQLWWLSLSLHLEPPALYKVPVWRPGRSHSHPERTQRQKHGTKIY